MDREVYSKVPDWRIPLTHRGREQAFDCGRRLRRLIRDEKLSIYYSPYARTQQTLAEIRRSFDESQIQGEREDERLREQEMGNYQPMSQMDATWAARNEFSRLYYRFPFGESGADVGDRVSGFFDSLLRERIGLTVPNMNERQPPDAVEELGCLGLGRWSGGEHRVVQDRSRAVPPLSSTLTSSFSREKMEPRLHGDLSQPAGVYAAATSSPSSCHSLQVSDLGNAEDRGVLPPNDHGAGAGEDQNVLIIAHGLLIRLFIGRWYRVPMEVFETMSNPPNCAIVVLERDDSIGRLVMTDMSRQLFGSDPLLQMMRFDGREDAGWYRRQFLGIIDPEKEAAHRPVEDDDENHYSKSAAHNTAVGAPPPPRRR